MEAITDRLTNDRIAERMISQITQGYTAPELVREWLIYIKLNQLENRLEPKEPAHEINRDRQDSRSYLVCPACNSDLVAQGVTFGVARFCYSCGQAIRWEGKNDERKV